MLKAFSALDKTKQNGQKDDLHALIARLTKPTTVLFVPSEYLEIVITKR